MGRRFLFSAAFDGLVFSRQLVKASALRREPASPETCINFGIDDYNADPQTCEPRS